MFIQPLPASIDAIPPEYWVGAAVVCLMLSLCSFFLGLYLGRTELKRGINRAGKEISQLVNILLKTMENAQLACSALESLKTFQINEQHLEKVTHSTNRLLESFSNIRQISSLSPTDQSEGEANSAPTEKLEIDWSLSPVNQMTGLPDRSAFDSNLSQLIAAKNHTPLESGLLLIQMDKFEQLQSRYSAHGATHFLKAIVSIVCKSIRDEDLVCQYSTDTIIVLMPEVTRQSGSKQAAAIRNAIRNHRFRLDAASPEVLVTASFGYSQCVSGDHADFILNRAANALAKSHSKGRNQLHISDGSELLYCGIC